MIIGGLSADLDKQLVPQPLGVEASADQVKSHRVQRHTWLGLAVTHVDLDESEQFTSLVLERLVQGC